jgi:hypothetical protein
MILAGCLRQGAQADGAVVHQRKTTRGKLLGDGLTGTRRFADGRPDPTFLAASAFDALSGLEESDRIEILGGLTAPADVTRRGRETDESGARQAEADEHTIQGDT